LTLNTPESRGFGWSGPLLPAGFSFRAFFIASPQLLFAFARFGAGRAFAFAFVDLVIFSPSLAVRPFAPDAG
jgi:hypothetical protein